MKAWYKNFTGVRFKPTQQELDSIRIEFEELLSVHPSAGDPLPIHVDKFAVNDEVPDETEIYAAIKHLRK